MRGSGAGAFFSGGGADVELRRKFEQYHRDDSANLADFSGGVRGIAADAHTHADPNQRSDSYADADSGMQPDSDFGGDMRSEQRFLRHCNQWSAGGQHIAVQCTGNLHNAFGSYPACVP